TWSVEHPVREANIADRHPHSYSKGALAARFSFTPNAVEASTEDKTSSEHAVEAQTSDSMASKFGVAGGIPERRVRQIWDAIDSRQYKNALKLSFALLTKYPTSPYALALKAVILERMGKPGEALSICLSAKELLHKNDSFLMDDLTLSTLQIVFQRLDRLDLATSCYEYACGKLPSNMELMMGLFNCYVREYSYVKQQQTALKLYKIAGEERFLLWAICSIMLQVHHGHGGEKLFVLAEGLIKKHINSHSLHEPEALIIYLSILEQQGKYRDALEILSGNLGSLLSIEVDQLRLQGRLLARAGDNASAASIFQKILKLRPDDWQCFLQYLGCLLEDDQSWCSGMAGETVHPPKSDNLLHIAVDMFDNRISDATDFVQKLLEETSSDPIRGPYLANLEIERRKLLHGKSDKGKILDSLVDYFSRFGHLSCFCSDVEVFLEVLNPDENTNLLQMLTQCSTSLSMTPTKSLGQSITLQKIQELIGDNYKLYDSELGKSAVKLLDLYCQNLALSKDLDPQESMHGEELLSTASNLLVQLFWRTRHIGYLLEAFMLLEFGLIIRRYVSTYKILLIHLYTYVGALPMAFDWYRTLDVKNILLETVSHHILPQMLLSPLWGDANDFLNNYLKFMDDHFRESADLTFLAYRHRNYSKVIEFVQFKERLQHSSQYLVAKVESSLLQLKEKAHNLEEEESVFESLNHGAQILERTSEAVCRSMMFNEDLQTRPWWTPTPCKNYLLGPFEQLPGFPGERMLQYKTDWEMNTKSTVNKRALLPRIIYLSIQCASAFLKETVETSGSASNQTMSLELKSLVEQYTKFMGISVDKAVEVLVDVSKGHQTLEVFGSEILDWANTAVFVNALSLSRGDHGLSGAINQPVWLMANSIISTCITQKVTVSGLLNCFPGAEFPTLVQLITEPLAWHILVIQSCLHSSLPSGKKKKKSGSADQSNSSLSNAIRDTIQSLFGTLEVVTKWLKEQIEGTEEEKMDSLLSSVTSGEHEGPGQVFQILKNLISTANEADLGNRIGSALKAWDPAEVARKLVKGQRQTLLELLRICNSKVQQLESLKQQAGHLIFRKVKAGKV
ncbi:hypothetical protein V2J09_018146, partial [Rumex salicifolius]